EKLTNLGMTDFLITQLTTRRLGPIIECEFKIFSRGDILMTMGMKRIAIPVVLSASLVFSRIGLSGTTVLAEEQTDNATTEGISKEDAAFLFLQTERADDTSTFSGKSVEQQLESAECIYQIIDKIDDSETY